MNKHAPKKSPFDSLLQEVRDNQHNLSEGERKRISERKNLLKDISTTLFALALTLFFCKSIISEGEMGILTTLGVGIMVFSSIALCAGVLSFILGIIYQYMNDRWEIKLRFDYLYWAMSILAQLILYGFFVIYWISNP